MNSPIPSLRFQTVLVVEDDEGLRDLTVETLEDIGVCVQAVATADEGYARLKVQRFSALLTDVVMPGFLNGWELAWLGHELDPAMTLIVTSGYQERLSERLPAGSVVLPKPWNLEALHRLIAKAETGIGSAP